MNTEKQSYCVTCRKKILKSYQCPKPYCPKSKGKFRNKQQKGNSLYSLPLWKGNPNKPLGQRGGIREAQLIKEPFCKHCKEEGLINEANVVDHIQDWKTGATEQIQRHLFTSPENLQSLCTSHHNSKTGKTN